MTEDESREAGEEDKREDLRYEDLAMNVVPASVTKEPSESGRRAWSLVLVVIAVLAVAGAGVLAGRVLLNPHPGREAETRLQQRLREELPEWREGFVLDAGYSSGDRAWLRFTPSVTTSYMANEKGEREIAVPSEDEREKIRQATRAAMETLVQERQGRDLFIYGFKGDDTIVEAHYRHKSTLVGPEGRALLDIVVRVAGDPEEGIGSTFDQRGRTRTTD